MGRRKGKSDEKKRKVNTSNYVYIMIHDNVKQEKEVGRKDIRQEGRKAGKNTESRGKRNRAIERIREREGRKMSHKENIYTSKERERERE